MRLKNYTYIFGMAAFLLSLGLFLLTLVDMRRAFLFQSSAYLKIGSPSTIFQFTPFNLLLFILGFLGFFFSYLYLVRAERKIQGVASNLNAITNFLAIAILVLLIVDLFTYRGVPASRIVASGKIGIGQAFSLEGPWWLQPFLVATNYFALVWHATFLGILIGALFIIMIGQRLNKITGATGFLSHLAGSALALPQPFCSCCAAPIGASLYRSGSSLGAMLAFTVSSPLLNLTGLILAISLLPKEFAFLRIAGGIFIGIFITYVVAILSPKVRARSQFESTGNKSTAFFTKLTAFYARLFHFENLFSSKTIGSPGMLISTWLKTSWNLGKIVVPILFVGSSITSAIFMALPSPENNVWGVLIASAAGTILMIPTWTEIPVAGTLISNGLNGPAAAMLLTLPAVSIPCLLIVGGAAGSSRVALFLGLATFITGIIAGLAFL